MSYIILFLKGAAIGIANSVPGVSGGTIAVITKVFDELMESITLNVRKLLKNMPFLIPLGLGMVAGIFVTAVLLEFLLEEYAVPTQLFFVGVIVGSIPMIFRECTKENKIKPLDILPFIAGLAIMLAIAVFTGGERTEISGEIDFRTAAGIVASSFVAGVSMLIPGVSGSLMLKALGFHTMAMNAVSNLDIPIIALFGIGAVLGILVIAKVLSFLLAKFRKPVYCVILGLIVGSVPNIFPPGFKFDTMGIIGIVLCAFGLFLPTLMELPSKNKSK